MKKNIIFPIEFNHLTGGMIHSVISLIKSLSKDYKIYIIAHKDAEIAQLGLDATPLFLNNPWCISLSAPLKTLKTHLEVRNLLRNFDKNDTLVFTNNVGSEMIFSGFGFFPIPLKRIFVSRGGDYTGKTGAVLKKGFNSVFRFVAVSESQKEKLIFATKPEAKIEVIHNGVEISNPTNFKYNPDKNIMNLSVVGYIGILKNQILAIRALPQLLNMHEGIKLNIYGISVTPASIEYEKQLFNEVEKLKLKDSVIFKGYESDKSSIYSNTDILLSCSVTEGFGRTIAEAMSFGIPCIGLKESGGLLDIISDKHDGYLIQNDADELASSILSLIQFPKLRRLISENAVHSYQAKFTEQKMCEKYHSFLKENF
jgi:glycosyltransferase involved in cell wall biosynthesis